MKFNKYILILLFLLTVVPAGVLYAESIYIQADKQTFDGKKTIFTGDVKVDYEDIRIESPKAIVRNDKEGKPIDATFVDGAYALKKSEFSRSEVKANIINLSLLKNRIRASGKSDTEVFEGKKPLVHINAGSQIFDTHKNVIVATEYVKIDYDKIKTNSDKARITMDDAGKLDKVEFLGNAQINQEKTIINGDKILYSAVTDQMTATGNTSSETLLEDGEKTNVLVWADYQHYDNASKTLITSGHVRIKYKDYIATGPKATFIPENGSTKPNKIIFIGRGRIQEAERYVEADRIEITLEPKNFKAEGNVQTRFTQVQSLKEASKKK